MNIPIFSPSRTLFRTSMSFQEVQSKLLEVFNAPKSPSWMEFFGKKCPQFYGGYVKEQSFFMKRVIAYNNSFLPVTNGKIRNTGKGSEVEIKTKMNTLGMVVMAIFSLIFIGIFIATMAMGGEIETENGIETIPTYIFILSSISLWVIIGYLHFKEVGRTRKFLSELLQASIEPLD